ncbi:MAG: hypothetical protein WD049_01030 [Candidatus Paceibacterota bacterium]
MSQVKTGELSEEQQWEKELLKILKVRNVEIVDLAKVEDLSLLKQRYNSSAEQVTDKVDTEKVASVEDALNQLDRQRCLVRRIDALDKRLQQYYANDKRLQQYYKKSHAGQPVEGSEFIGKYVTASEKIGSAKHALELEHYDVAASFLSACESVKFFPDKDIEPAHPSEPVERKLDPEAITKALKRKDLAERIAQNDTWRNFDIDRALRVEPLSEADAKVLWNVLESAIQADEEDAKWTSYKENVEREVLHLGRRKLTQEILAAHGQLVSIDSSESQAPKELIGQAKKALEERKFDEAEEFLNKFLATNFLKGTALENVQRAGAEAKTFRIYQEVILGAGASAAYYIANNESKIDIPNTLMIGKVQPWAGERGKDGNINHPHNMIDAEHTANEIQSEHELAKRTEFSERVAEVVGRLNSVDAKISKVIKCKGDYFEIQTTAGSFYGKKITNALGIGNHTVPPNDVTGAAKEKFQNMDTFKRNLDGEGQSMASVYRGVTDVAIIGPNAAIDVATTIIRDNRKVAKDKQVHIHWFVGVGKEPFFLDGTDNELVKEEYPQPEEYPQLKAKTGTATKGQITTYKWDFLNASGSGNVKISYGQRAVNRGENPVEEGQLEVQLAVYAIGPDTGAMKQMFSEETVEGKSVAPLDLEPVYDRDQHFNFNIEEKNPAELIKKLKLSLEQDKDLCDWLSDPDLKDVNVLFETLPPVIGVQGSGKQGEESSMEFVGASAMRMAQNDRLTYDYISKIIGDKKNETSGRAQSKIEEFERILSDLKQNQNLDFVKGKLSILNTIGDDPAVQMVGKMLREFLNLHITVGRDKKERFDGYGSRVTSEPMGTVTKSLPDNVVINDQLTSSRAQIEARYNEMPTDPDSVPLVTREGGINFITSDHTVIATHLAYCYPNIPPALADYITAQIVNARTTWKDERRPLPARKEEVDEVQGERIHDLRQQKAFQDEWVKRLRQFDKKFKSN